MKRILTLVLLTLMTFSLTACGAVSCSFGGEDLFGTTYNYDFADEYTRGGADLTDPVSELEISWVTGSVSVAYHDKDTVSFSETSNQADTETTSLYYRLKNGHLTIHFAKSGRVDLTKLSKDLTVYLPRSLALSDLQFSLVSAKATAEGIAAAESKIDTVSGNVAFKDCDLDSLAVNTVSGKVFVTDVGNGLDTIDFDSVSGDLEIVTDSVSKLEVDSVSASVVCHQRTPASPKTIDFDSTSGNLTLYLPAGVGMTVDFSSVSGDLDSDHAGDWEGDDTFTLGDGSCDCEFDSISGDLFLKEPIMDRETAA